MWRGVQVGASGAPLSAWEAPRFLFGCSVAPKGALIMPVTPRADMRVLLCVDATLCNRKYLQVFDRSFLSEPDHVDETRRYYGDAEIARPKTLPC